MFPGFFYFDKSKITNVKLKGLVSVLGVIGSTIKSVGALSTFGTTGNRCCSGNDKMFIFNYDGDMYINDSVSLKSSVLVKASTRPVLLRNCGSTCNKDYVYVVNGTTNGIGGILGTPSNSFQRYSISTNTWSTLAVAPLSVYNTEIAINSDLGDYVYYTNGANFYRYNISTNVWSNSGLSSHGLTLGIHGLLYYSGYLYLCSGNVLRRYNISTNTWSTLASMPLLSTAVRMFRYKEFIYIFGGLTGVLEYSIKDNVYRTVNSTINLSGDICAGVIEGAGYMVSGTSIYKIV